MKWIPRSKSGASKSRPRWAAHTRIGNVWEYPPPRGIEPPPRLPSVKIGFFRRGGVGRYTGFEDFFPGKHPRSGKMLTSCAVPPSFISIYNIRRIRKYLDQKSLLTLVHAFITS